MLRVQDLLVMVLQRIGFRYKKSLGLRSGFQVKFLQSSQRLVLIGCLTLSSRRDKVSIHQPRSQLVESVARSTMVVVKEGTRLGISLV